MYYPCTEELSVFATDATSGERVLINNDPLPESFDRSGILYECIADFGRRGISWIIESFDGKDETILNGMEEEDHDMFLVTNVGDQYITLSFLDDFSGRVGCAATGASVRFDVYAIGEWRQSCMYIHI